jgi:hypothetical protein
MACIVHPIATSPHSELRRGPIAAISKANPTTIDATEAIAQRETIVFFFIVFLRGFAGGLIQGLLESTV